MLPVSLAGGWKGASLGSCQEFWSGTGRILDHSLGVSSCPFLAFLVGRVPLLKSATSTKSRAKRFEAVWLNSDRGAATSQVLGSTGGSASVLLPGFVGVRPRFIM